MGLDGIVLSAACKDCVTLWATMGRDGRVLRLRKVFGPVS